MPAWAEPRWPLLVLGSLAAACVMGPRAEAPCCVLLCVSPESPTNPYLRCVDVPRIASLCHAAGALVVIDSTFATPINQRALALGADLVIHSATKYLAGHNDVMAGAAGTLISQNRISTMEDRKSFSHMGLIRRSTHLACLPFCAAGQKSASSSGPVGCSMLLLFVQAFCMPQEACCRPLAAVCHSVTLLRLAESLDMHQFESEQLSVL
jgi:hypothetical protein